MVTSVGGVAIQIRGDNTQFVRELRESERQAGRTGQVISREFAKADGAAQRLNTSLKSSATSMLALTAAFGVGAGLAGGIRIIANFSQSMATLRAITGGTAEEIARLEAQARALGSSTKYSASQAADAMTELARAGFNTEQVLAAIPSVLSLATAGGVELAAAAEITGVTLAQFGLQAAEAARVADVLAEAANRSNVGVTDLGEALKYAGPTGKALGLDLEQTVAVLAALGDGGLKGGQGGRSFGSVGVQLVNMREEITALIGTYDIAAEGIQGVIRRLVEAGITTEQVISIFRGENIDTFNILAAASTSATKSIDGFIEGLRGAEGSSARVAAVMADNLNGAIQGAASAFEELIIALGKAGAEPAITAAIKGLADLLRFAARNADVLAVAVVALSARALIPLVASAVPAAITSLRALSATLLATQGAAARATLALSVIGGPLTLAIAGAAAAYLAFARANVTAEEAQAGFNETAGKLKGVQDDTRTATDELKDANDRLTKAIEAQQSAAEATARAEIDAINRRLAKNRELEASYRAQLALDLNRARQGAQGSENRLGERFGLRATFDFTSNRNVDDAQLDAKISEFMRRADAIQKAGGVLSKYDAQTLEWIIQYREYQETLRGLEGAFTDLTQRGPAFGTDLREFVEGPRAATATGTTPSTATTTEIDREALAIREQIVAIDLARAAGNEQLARHLEEELELLQAQLEYQDLGLDAVEAMDRAITEIVGKRQAAAQFAQEQAEADEAAARALAAYEEFDLRRKENKRIADEAAKAEEEMRQRIADGIASGLEQGIRSGNWGEAFRDVLASATSDALRQSIDELATELLNLFKGIFSQQGGSNFGGVGSIFGSVGTSIATFLGGRAGGGSVRAGMRYMVGENGPEMFVPSVPGTVVPRFEGPASAAAGGLPGVQSLSISAPLIVQGSITEDVLPRVQAMMAAQARELPRVIDARVADSIRRNRY